jgi:hypothetical protein
MSMYLFTVEALQAEHAYRTERLRRSARRFTARTLLARSQAPPHPVETGARSAAAGRCEHAAPVTEGATRLREPAVTDGATRLREPAATGRTVA